MILGAVKGALLKRGATVDGCVAGGANLKLGKLVKLNFYGIMRVALALRLCLSGLLGEACQQDAQFITY